MSCLRKLLLILFSISQLVTSAEDPTAKPLKFDALTINEGLSQGMVMSVMQDRYGFMWFGTKEGLNRYDGYSFKVFRNVPGDSSTLSDNCVQWVYEDGAGRLWAGTAAGLNLFDRSSETFRRFTAGTGPGMLAQGNVHGIVEDKDGNLLVVQDKVIDKLALTEKNGALHVDIVHSSPLNFPSIELLKRRDGSFYLSCINEGLFRLYVDSFPKVRTEAVTASVVDVAGKGDSIALDKYKLVVLDARNDVVYFTYGEKLVRVDAAGNAAPVCEDCIHETGFGYSLIDSNGVILTNADRMLVKIDTHSGKRESFYPWEQNQRNAIRHIFILYKDRSGTLWMGSNGYGLLRHNTFSEKFHHTDHYSIIRMMLSEKGDVILNDDFISKDWFDKEKVIVYDSAAAKNKKQYGHGFSETSYPTWRTKEKIWFTDDASLFCYDRARNVMADSVKLPGEPSWFTQSIYDDEKQFVWVGTGQGVLRFNPKDKTWKQYKQVPGDTTSLRSNSVLCITPHAKRDGYLWVGTNGGGLHLMDTKTGTFKAYTTADGLPNDVVYGVLNDDEGNMWVSTNKGLSRFNPEKMTFKNFEEKDGLQSNEFNRGAYCKTSDGWLFFGGVNGFNFFNPKEMSDNKFIPQTIITDLKIRNKSLSFRDEKSPLKKPVYLSKEITLPYNENMISFEFASMDFTAPAKNMFQYKMENFDENWIHAGNNHSATYTNLDPGMYTFMVKSSNHDGVWNKEGVSFIVTILPPWYMTWWFRVFVVVVVAALAYWFYRYRLSHALKLQEVRNRIAQDLHDEIGSNLSTISIFADMAIAKSKNKSEHLTPLLNKINDYTQTSMEAMSDIVWMINSRNDRFENIIVHMRAHAAELLEAKNIKLHMNFDERLNNVKLGMGERKNFYLIYKEALNNIVKYAECKNVWIEMKQNNSTVYLKIKDDGKGFNTANPERGNGLINMQKRAEMLSGDLKIESVADAGATVTLRFSI